MTVPEELLQQVRTLTPWHMNIELTPDLKTGDGNPHARGTDDVRLSLINPRELRPLLETLHPDGLQGRSFLDCACNAGGYSLLASDLGAERCFGFDVREHWIEQARFLQRHLGKTDDQVRFEVCDLLEVGERIGDQRFDICLFKGIFYHLPDPMAALKVVADRTDDVLILDTAAATGYEDGFLKVFWEGVEHPMSGVHNLAWRPTGPLVLTRILEWLGFAATCTIFWRRHPPDRIEVGSASSVPGIRPGSGLRTPPVTAVVAPEDGTGVTGATELPASVAKRVVEVDRVEFRLTGSEHEDELIATAERTKRGQKAWIGTWDAGSVAPGTYTLHSVAVDAASQEGRSPGTAITVEPGRRWSRRGR